MRAGWSEENGVSVAVDSITSGSLVELEELLHMEPLAGHLADLRSLRMADPTLRDVLATFPRPLLLSRRAAVASQSCAATSQGVAG